MTAGSIDKRIRVLVVDDSQLTRVSLKTTLKTAQQLIECVGEAEDGHQAIEAVEHLHPDIVLMDIGMPIMDGIRATQTLKQQHPHTRIIMLTSHESDEDVLDAFNAGAQSYCLKETPPEMLVNVIVSTAHGACWIDPKISRVVMRQFQPTSIQDDYISRLTEREVDVLKEIAHGLNNTEISEQLCISMNTVKTHLKSIFQKLEVDDRTAAALKAIKARLI